MAQAADRTVRRLRASGRRVTAQRRAIVQTLASLGCARSAEDVHRQARRTQPRLGLVTVYRTLDTLVAEGLVQSVHLGDGRTRYELVDLGHHHHLVCLSCGAVQRLEGCLLRSGARAGVGRGFTVTGHRLEFIGYCAACRRSA